MKRLLFLLLILGNAHTDYASIECIDNSWHLAQSFDHKEYHPVTDCLCPCEKQYKLSRVRGRCSHCDHERFPKPFIIIRSKLDK